MKFMLQYKAEKIRELEAALDHEKVKHHEKLEKERDQSRRSIEFLKEQIQFKDKRIDFLLDAVFEKDKQLRDLFIFKVGGRRMGKLKNLAKKAYLSIPRILPDIESVRLHNRQKLYKKLGTEKQWFFSPLRILNISIVKLFVQKMCQTAFGHVGCKGERTLQNWCKLVLIKWKSISQKKS